MPADRQDENVLAEFRGMDGDLQLVLSDAMLKCGPLTIATAMMLLAGEAISMALELNPQIDRQQIEESP